MTFVVCSPITLATLLFTSMTRYGRPVDAVERRREADRAAERLELRQVREDAASFAPSVEPP